MNRRGFLRQTSVVGLAALVAPDLVRGVAAPARALAGAAFNDSRFPGGYGSPALIWELTAKAMAVSTYGSPLEAIRGNGWRGSGIFFLLSESSGSWLPIRSFSEAQPEVDFWVMEDGLYIEQTGIDDSIGNQPRLSPGVRFRFSLDLDNPEEFDLEAEFPAEARRLRSIVEVQTEMATLTTPVPNRESTSSSTNSMLTPFSSPQRL